MTTTETALLSRPPHATRVGLKNPRILEPGLVAFIVVAGTVISWLRLPVATRGTLWAEDARDFLGNAVVLGPIPALWHPYAGYLHTVPRIIAGLTVQFVPILEWAHSMALGSCVVTAVVAALVFVCSRDIVSGLWGRLGLAAVTILVPLAPREVLGNTANIHWYFLWLAPWLLMHRSRSNRSAWVLAVAALLATLTEIQMVVFVPLLFRRTGRGARLPVRLLYGIGAATQLIVTVVSPRHSSGASENGIASVAYGYLINCVMTIWLPGSKAIGSVLVHDGPTAGIVCLLPFIIAGAWVFVNGSQQQRLMVGILLISSATLWVLAVHITPGTYYNYSTESAQALASPWITRYGVVPSLSLLAVLVIAITVRKRPVGAQRQDRATAWPLPHVDHVSTVVRAVVIVTVACFVLAQFTPSSTRRSGGPLYEPQVSAAQEMCVGRPAVTPVVLSAPPDDNWKIYTTCSRFQNPAKPRLGDVNG